MTTKNKTTRKTATSRAIDVTTPPPAAPRQAANGSKKPPLKQAVADWITAGSPMPMPDQATGLLHAYRGAHNAVAQAKQNLEAVQAAESKTVLALAKAYGGRPLKIDGVVHEFAARGDVVFFRRRQMDVIDVA